jgi:CheY-like chemotaxis protein
MSRHIIIIDNNKSNLNILQEVFNTFSSSIILNEEHSFSTNHIGAIREMPKENWPRLILLCLDLEGFMGFEILETIKSDPLLKVIPIIVYSESDYLLDINYSYQSLANAYIHFSGDKNEIKSKAENTCSYWLNRVQPAY